MTSNASSSTLKQGTGRSNVFSAFTRGIRCTTLHILRPLATVMAGDTYAKSRICDPFWKFGPDNSFGDRLGARIRIRRPLDNGSVLFLVNGLNVCLPRVLRGHCP